MLYIIVSPVILLRCITDNQLAVVLDVVQRDDDPSAITIFQLIILMHSASKSSLTAEHCHSCPSAYQHANFTCVLSYHINQNCLCSAVHAPDLDLRAGGLQYMQKGTIPLTGVSQRPFTKWEALQAKEVFLCGSSIKVRGVTQWDDSIIGHGRVGEFTMQLNGIITEDMEKGSGILTAVPYGYLTAAGDWED